MFEEGFHTGPDVLVYRERDRQHSLLRRLHPRKDPTGQESVNAPENNEDIIRETRRRIENNIETLDYLRGISCLERDFVRLADNVVKTSLQLSHQCNDINREALSPTQLSTEVDTAWEHISKLGNTVQTHVKHAKRYHLFYLAMDMLDRNLNEIDRKVNEISASQPPEEKATNDISNQMDRTLESLVQAYVSWQKIQLKLPLVAPLHRRMPLGRGHHSGTLLTTISLPPPSDSDAAEQRHLEAGSMVQVRANKPSDLLHREWLIDGEDYGVVSVPAAFVWLNSQESSPERPGEGILTKRSRSVLEPRTNKNYSNKESVENLKGKLFNVWENACSKFDQILRGSSIAWLNRTLREPPNARTDLDKELFGKAIKKISSLAGIVESQQEDGTDNLVKLLEDTKARMHDGDAENSIHVDGRVAEAMAQAIDIFEEFVGCYQRYGSQSCSEAFPADPELFNQIKRGVASSNSPEDPQDPNDVDSSPIQAVPSQIRLYAEKPKEEQLLQFQPKPVSPTHHRQPSRSASITSYPLKHEVEVPIVTEETSEVVGTGKLKLWRRSHSLSRLHSKKRDEQTAENEEEFSKHEETPKRSRRRDRMLRLLPVLLRRHSRKREIENGTKATEISAPSDIVLSPKSSTWVQRGTPKDLQSPLETGSLGRIPYMKSTDSRKMRRAPLIISTLDSGIYTEAESSGPATDPIIDEPRFAEPLFASATQIGDSKNATPVESFSVSCQNGVITSSIETYMDEDFGDRPKVQTLGKKLQVGTSFTAAPELEVESTQASHVYANLPNSTDTVSTGITANPQPELYDIGVQVGLPNRLRAVSCRLEFEQPGVELGERASPATDGYGTPSTAPRAPLEEGLSEHEDNALSFRVDFGNKTGRLASTL